MIDIMPKRTINPNFKKLEMLKKNYDVNFLHAHEACQELLQYLQPYIFPIELIDPDNEDQKLPKELSHLDTALKEYVIVKTCAIVENGFKNLIIFLIDHVKVDFSLIRKFDHIEIKFDDIDAMLNKKISKGLLIANEVSLSKPYLINSCMSKLLKLDFHNSLGGIVKATVSPDAFDQKNVVDLIDLFLILSNFDGMKKEFEEIFEMRNQIVHNIESPSLNNIKDLWNWVDGNSLYLHYGIAFVLFFALFCTKNPNKNSLLQLDYFKNQKRDKSISESDVMEIFEKIFGISSLDLKKYIHEQQKQYKNSF